MTFMLIAGAQSISKKGWSILSRIYVATTFGLVMFNSIQQKRANAIPEETSQLANKV